MPVLPARIIHISIDRPWREVYVYVAKPENMQFWASGLAAGLKQEGNYWIGDGGPIGKIRVQFSPDNPYGILDHTVTMEDGTVVDNAMRVVANGSGSEVMFVLLRRPDMDEQALESDAAHVLKDLEALKTLMEGQSSIKQRDVSAGPLPPP